MRLACSIAVLELFYDCPILAARDIHFGELEIMATEEIDLEASISCMTKTHSNAILTFIVITKDEPFINSGCYNYKLAMVTPMLRVENEAHTAELPDFTSRLL